MNAYEQLLAIRDRLEQNGASEDSVEFVEKFIRRAQPEQNSSTSVAQVLMLRHLLKQREAIDNYSIYNDLQELMSAHEERQTRDDDVRPAYEDNDRHPKPKSYYKALKEKERNS